MTESVKSRLTAAACLVLVVCCRHAPRDPQQAPAPAAPLPSMPLPSARHRPGLLRLWTRLTLADAERMAIQHNPDISVARLSCISGAGTGDARGKWWRVTHGEWQPYGRGLTRIPASRLAF